MENSLVNDYSFLLISFVLPSLTWHFFPPLPSPFFLAFSRRDLPGLEDVNVYLVEFSPFLSRCPEGPRPSFRCPFTAASVNRCPPAIPEALTEVKNCDLDDSTLPPFFFDVSQSFPFLFPAFDTRFRSPVSG